MHDYVRIVWDASFTQKGRHCINELYTASHPIRNESLLSG